MRTHTGERPFKCTQPKCGKAFASLTNYKNHVRIHSGEKPYMCMIDDCRRRFTEYSSLYKHHLIHRQQKPYECNLCARQYRQNSTLMLHKRTAHGPGKKNKTPRGRRPKDPESTCEQDARVLEILLESSAEIMGRGSPATKVNYYIHISISQALFFLSNASYVRVILNNFEFSMQENDFLGNNQRTLLNFMEDDTESLLTLDEPSQLISMEVSFFQLEFFS